MTTEAPSRAELAARIDHTLLRPEATRADVLMAAREAADHGCASVCVSPVHLPLGDVGVRVCTVVGFPSGAHATEVKAAEAARAVSAGAEDIDMVVHLGAVDEGDWDAVTADIAAVRAVVPAPLVLKVIIESAALVPDQIDRCCAAAEQAGADLVKTSTGFHPAGGATVEAVARMAAAIGGRLGVKASGGIRTHQEALALLEAGATRLGTSSTRAILDGLSPVE
jgi:deoxyribose-phosphate aldolase